MIRFSGLLLRRAQVGPQEREPRVADLVEGLADVDVEGAERVVAEVDVTMRHLSTLAARDDVEVLLPVAWHPSDPFACTSHV